MTLYGVISRKPLLQFDETGDGPHPVVGFVFLADIRKPESTPENSNPKNTQTTQNHQTQGDQIPEPPATDHR